MPLASMGVAALHSTLRPGCVTHSGGVPEHRAACDRLCTVCPAPLRNVFVFSRAQGWEDQASREPEWPVDIQYHLTPSQEHLPTAEAAGQHAS